MNEPINDTIMTRVFWDGQVERTYCEGNHFNVVVYPGQAFGWVPSGGRVELEAA